MNEILSRGVQSGHSGVKLIRCRIKLEPIKICDVECLDESEYKNLSREKRLDLINSSIIEEHNGKFFKFFLLKVDGNIAGFFNVYAHSNKDISIAPEIKYEYRNKGYATKSLNLLYKIFRKMGYKTIRADIRAGNISSLKLHKKLGFVFIKKYVNENGREMILYKKSIVVLNKVLLSNRVPRNLNRRAEEAFFG